MRPVRDTSQVGEIGLQTPHIINVVRRRRRVRAGLGRVFVVAFRGFCGGLGLALKKVELEEEESIYVE